MQTEISECRTLRITSRTQIIFHEIQTQFAKKTGLVNLQPLYPVAMHNWHMHWMKNSPLWCQNVMLGEHNKRRIQVRRAQP